MTDQFKVFIDHSGDEKYIVVYVTPPEGSPYYAVVSKALGYHSDILEEFSNEMGPSQKLKVMGGGILQIERSEKFLKCYGRSGGFGRPDRDLVERILRACYPDWTLEITVTNYIRG